MDKILDISKNIKKKVLLICHVHFVIMILAEVVEWIFGVVIAETVYAKIVSSLGKDAITTKLSWINWNSILFIFEIWNYFASRHWQTFECIFQYLAANRIKYNFLTSITFTLGVHWVETRIKRENVLFFAAMTFVHYYLRSWDVHGTFCFQPYFPFIKRSNSDCNLETCNYLNLNMSFECNSSYFNFVIHVLHPGSQQN